LTLDDRKVLAAQKSELIELLKPNTHLSHPPALSWRESLAVASDAIRERWGLRANALEDAGLSWRDAERQAWVEIVEQQRDERPEAA
jgi:hypothetical protein